MEPVLGEAVGQPALAEHGDGLDIDQIGACRSSPRMAWRAPLPSLRSSARTLASTEASQHETVP
jgi:hypothetical protein